MKIKDIKLTALVFAIILVLTSCEEKGLLVNSNDIAYLRFQNNMTKDTTTVSFKMYNEGEDAVIPIMVSINGAVQQEDLHFNVSTDMERTTLDANLYELPSDCKMRKSLLTDTFYVTLKNAPELKTATKYLAIQVNETENVRQGDRNYSRAIIAVTDRLFKPSWWSVNDAGSEDNPGNSVDWYYLGEYSETKYQMFLEELKKDDVVFDGKNKLVLRKYALKLKNTLLNMNAGKAKEEWVKDENGQVIEVPVAG